MWYTYGNFVEVEMEYRKLPRSRSRRQKGKPAESDGARRVLGFTICFDKAACTNAAASAWVERGLCAWPGDDARRDSDTQLRNTQSPSSPTTATTTTHAHTHTHHVRMCACAHVRVVAAQYVPQCEPPPRLYNRQRRANVRSNKTLRRGW